MMFRSQGSFQELLKKDIHDVNVQFNLRLAFKIQKFFSSGKLRGKMIQKWIIFLHENNKVFVYYGQRDMKIFRIYGYW